MTLARTKVKQGWLEGTDCGDYAVYKGIPYAKPPVGTLRFKAPERPERWEGVRYAQDFPAVCWQEEPKEGSFYHREFYQGTWEREERSEDCLYLNIWTPTGEVQDKCAVMLWIHGGALKHGYGHEKEFDGAAFCRRNVILVTIQYRLGVFGFFAHPWLCRETAGKAAFNFALLDQIAALNWIYENIAAFGGDPERITVAGQSAGGVSVQALLASPLTEGKIHQAILQSGGGYGQLERRSLTVEEACRNGERLAQKCGAETLEGMRGMEAGTLLKLAGDFECRFVKDGFSIPEEGESVLYRKTFPAAACLLGSTQNDIRVTKEMVENGIFGDLYRGNLEFAQLLGRRNIYLYYFTRRLPGDGAGAFHSAELWYMFGTLSRCWRRFEKEDHILSEKMVDYWCSFVKDGAPAKAEEWPPYAGLADAVKIL